MVVTHATEFDIMVCSFQGRLIWCVFITKKLINPNYSHYSSLLSPLTFFPQQVSFISMVVNFFRRNLATLLALILLVSVVPKVSAINPSLGSWGLGYGLLESPVGIAAGGGMVFVSDDEKDAIIVMDTEGNLITEKNKFNGKEIKPAGLYFSKDSILYVTDMLNDRLLILTPNLDLISEVSESEMKISDPVDVTLGDNSYIYVLSSADRKVSILTSHGKYLRTILSPGVFSGQLASPRGIDISGELIAISDMGVGKAKIISESRGELRTYGIPGTYPSSLSAPSDVCMDSTGNLYVVDKNNNDIAVYPKSGLEPFSWGRYGKVGKAVDFFFSDIEPRDFSDSPGRLCRPTSISIDGDCVYIADTGNSRILVTSLSEIWRIPRISLEFFSSQRLDVPRMIASPSTLHFGNVDGTLTKYVNLELTNNPTSIGRAYIRGDKSITVEPEIFTGSNVRFKVTVNSKTTIKNINSTLVIESITDSIDIPLSGTHSKSPGIFFSCNSQCRAQMRDEGAYVSLELVSQNGFSGDVKLSATQPIYSPVWARPATDVEDIKLTTVGINFRQETISLSSSEKKMTSLSVYESGRLRSGVYYFSVFAESANDPSIKAIHSITLYIESESTGDVQGTVLYETFTAHWCSPCGYHREASYRLAEEYGRRNIMPIAFHVMDEDDETGMTTDLNFSRFKMYGGTGVPLSVMNGKTLNVSGNGEVGSKFAPDRIRGRKYSGTTFEYWKLRAEYNSIPRVNPLIIKLSAEIDDKGEGSVYLRVDESKSNRGRLARVYFLIVEDGIEYYAENGEIQHNFVVRDFLKPNETESPYSDIVLGKERNINFSFELPDMNEGFELNPDNLTLVAIVEDIKTKNIIGSHWMDLSAPVICTSELFTSGDTSLNRGAQSKVYIHISNIGSCTKSFGINVSLGSEYMDMELTDNFFVITPGETKTATLYLSLLKVIDNKNDLFIDISAKDSDNKTYTKKVVFGSK